MSSASSTSSDASSTAPSTTSASASITSNSSNSSSAAPTSWFAKAKSLATTAAVFTSQAVAAGVESTKRTVAEMKAPPSTIACTGCQLQVQVPNNLFDWTCTEKHVNDRTKTTCSTCHLAKSKQLDRTVVCSACQTTIVVPETNAEKSFKSGVENTKKFATTAVQSAKDQVNYLKSAPETFHCAHCNTLLAVPTGPWMCQTCTAENAEEAKQCKQCTQRKTEQRCLCGVCGQSTPIPTSNFSDGFGATMRDISKSGRKIYYDVSKKPYVSCPRCACHVPLPEKLVPAAPSAAAGSASTEGSAAPVTEAQPPAYQADIAPHGSLASLSCPNCKNPIEQ